MLAVLSALVYPVFMGHTDENDKTYITTGSPLQKGDRHCPTCGLEVGSTTTVCPQDGTAIVQTPGTMLARAYEFIGVTGFGGMSIIYKARERESQRIVAIKMLHSLVMNDAAMVRFQHEAQAIRSLRHPNIISVYDFGVSEHGQPYMVMDFIAGKNLAQHIKEQGALSVEESLPLFLQICDALEHAHRRGILHRDLKPGNIMLAQDAGAFENARIVDFGIAKLMGKDSEEAAKLTRTGELFGSPLYMSPEQCRGSEVDARSDIYAMGCVMFETLTGMPPIYGSTMVETIMMQLNTIPPSLSESCPDKQFPPALESAIATALAKDPNARFQNMNELKLQLMQIHPDKTYSRSTWFGRRKRRQFKFPKIATVAIASFLLGLITLPIVFMSHHHRERNREAANIEESEEAHDRDYEMYKSWNGFRETGSQLIDDESIGRFLASPRARNLKQLPLGGAIFLTDKGAASLRYLRSLQALSLENTMITDKTLAVLKDLTSLQLLSLRGTMITDAGMPMLRSLSNLQCLLLSDTDITDKALATVGRLKSLKELTVSDTDIGDSGLSNLRGFKLRRLFLAHTNVTDAGLDVIQNMTSLEELHLNDTKISDAGLAKLANLTHLRELSISNTQISDGGLANIENMQNLQILHVGCPHVTDAGMVHLQKLGSLQILDLAGANITDKALPAIAQMKGLRELTLSKADITDAGLAEIAKMYQLDGLDLSGTSITSEGIKKLGKLHGLKVLILSDCKNIHGSNNQMRQDLKTTIIYTTRYNLTEGSQLHLLVLQRAR